MEELVFQNGVLCGEINVYKEMIIKLQKYIEEKEEQVQCLTDELYLSQKYCKELEDKIIELTYKKKEEWNEIQI